MIDMSSARNIRVLGLTFLVLVFTLLVSLWNYSENRYQGAADDTSRRQNLADDTINKRTPSESHVYWQVSNAINKYGNISVDIAKLAEAKKKGVLVEKDFTPMTLSVDTKKTMAETGKLLEKLNKEKVKQHNEQLVRIIRDNFIFPPSREPYNLDNPKRLEYSNGQAPFVDSRLNYMESGFYIECGALNGEKGSNTLFFEKVRKWKGLLIEADPENFQALRSKHRKAFIMNACLNPYDFPARVQFNKAFNRGRVIHDDNSLNWIHNENIQLRSVNMQCFPLYSILLALNQTRIDYFSLDIEGDELGVLKTIPWDKVDIRMLSVEYIHETGKHQELQSYMESKGYDTLLKMQRDDGGVNDLIFRRKDLNH